MYIHCLYRRLYHCEVVTTWKTIRITKDAWTEAKKIIVGYDNVDLDDFLSYIVKSTDLKATLKKYIKEFDKAAEAEAKKEKV